MHPKFPAHTRILRLTKRLVIFAAIGLCLVVTAVPTVAEKISSPPEMPPLTLEQRYACQRSLEEVGWRHRIWPESNPQPRPALDEVVGPELIAAKVEKALRLSAAQEVIWRRPITPQQLQAEIERMAQQSRQPEVLAELWQALDNDPYLVAECLARPLLAERLAHSRYAFDNRIHGALHRQAEQGLAWLADSGSRSAVSGSYREVELRRGTTDDEDPASGVVTLRPERWQAEIDRLAAAFRQAPLPDLPVPSKADAASLPIGRFSPLREERDRFSSQAILEQNDGVLRMALVSWPKESFDAWLHRAADRIPVNADASIGAVSTGSGGYRLPAIRRAIADQWTPTPLGPKDGRTDHAAIWTGTDMILWGGWASSYEYPSIGFRYRPATDSWLSTNENGSPAGRAGHSALWTGDEMVVWGGWDGEQHLGDGGRYDPASDTWSTVSNAGAPTARSNHTTVWTDTLMIVWGGEDETAQLAGGGRYDPTTDLWSPIESTNAPEARTGAGAVWTGSQVVLWGGYGSGGLLKTGGRYDPVADTWATTESLDAPTARWRHGTVWTGDDMIVWGGWQADGFCSTGARYDPAADSWLDLSDAGAPSARAHHGVVWTGATMIVWGGWDGIALGSGGAYDDVTNSWSTITESGSPGARYRHTALWTGDEMIAWGGTGEWASRVDGGRYDPSTDSWVATGLSLAPSPRSNHTAVWTGEDMIIWGGWVSDKTGARYNPATHTWHATSTDGAPIARRDHSAIWNGQRMIVWGGEEYYGDETRTGGRYDPVSDTWWGMTSSGAPTARAFHSAIWTGSEMIICGGSNGWSPRQDSGRYHPGTDSWTTVNTAGAPPTRTGTIAVWAENEMLAWSGSEYGGGRYDPVTDSWVDITAGNAPQTGSSLSDFDLVWSGDEMLLWSGPEGLGGRWDPDTDTWSAMSSVGGPSVRRSFRAVWTGNEMLIWGGISRVNPYDALATGGRYDPATDGWQPTTTAGAPLPRYNHSTVWAGTAMIVWGGRDDDYDRLDSGGIYGAEIIFGDGFESGDTSSWSDCNG